MVIKGIIFDMDGVLINSEQLHAQSGRDVIGKHGIELTQEDLNHMLGMTDDDCYVYLIQKYKLNEKAEKLSKQREEKYIKLAEQELGAFPGTTDMLAKLSQEYKIGLATSGTKPTVEIMFSHFPWKKYFSTIVTREDVRFGKPNPEPYALAAERLGLKTSECVVVEDALRGIESGKAAGCKVVGVTYSFSEEMISTNKVKADKIAKTQQEVIEKIKEIELEL